MSSRRSRPEVSAEKGLDSPRERVSEWLLLNGQRTAVAFAIVAVLAGVFGTISLVGLAPMRDLQAVFYVYSGLLVGNVTLVTVVVSINQLLLSRELQTPGELRTQIDEVIDYRSEVEDATDEIAPVEPLGFLQLLVEATREEAQRLGGLARDGSGTIAADEIDGEVERLTEQMDLLDALLAQSEEDTIDVLSLLLETNYARDINRFRRVKRRHLDDIDDAMSDSIDSLIDRLQEIDVARQYFKTIYLQQELSRLSRLLLYVGVPAVGVSVVSLLLLTVPAGEPGSIPRSGVFLPVTLTVGTLPLAVLYSYTLRMATVTNLTAATLPFTTPEQER